MNISKAWYVLSSLHYAVWRLIEIRIPLQERQRGIGSEAHDPTQSDIRKFFGGGVVDGNIGELEEGRAISNALDGTVVPRP